MSVRWHKLPDANATAEAGAHHIVGLLEESLSGHGDGRMVVEV